MVKTFYLLQVFQKLTKSLKNFLQGQNVSGNFVTKLPYYFQVCPQHFTIPEELLLTLQYFMHTFDYGGVNYR